MANQQKKKLKILGIIVTVLGARFGIDSKVAMHIMTVG